MFLVAQDPGLGRGFAFVNTLLFLEAWNSIIYLGLKEIEHLKLMSETSSISVRLICVECEEHDLVEPLIR